MPNPNALPIDDPDSVETMPVAEKVPESAVPSSSEGWESEAPTAVQTLRPVFAPSPRLPTII